MTRLRFNDLSATLGASLSSSGTTITFAAPLAYNGGATSLPSISSSDYLPIVIQSAGGSEIAYVSPYTSGATTATLSARGQEGTTGVAHSSGDKVVHGPTALDLNGDTSWTAPTLNSGWTNLGGGWAPVGYRKDALGFVHLRGAITNSGTGGTAFNLPAGYRPSSAGQLGWLPLGGSTGQQVRVTSAGDVVRDSGTGYVMLDMISFLAEQ